MFSKGVFLSFLSICAFCFCMCVAYAEAPRPCNCYPGWYCSNSVCNSCNIGHYCINNVEYACQGNTISSSPGNSSCAQCLGEQRYANESHTVCVACDSGPYIKSNGVCVRCSGSTPFSNENHTQCVTCSSSFVSGGVCRQTCTPGKYKNSNGVCEDCDAGYYCSGDGTKKLCSKGTYSAAGQSECTLCPNGYTTAGSGTSGGSQSVCAIKIKAVLKIGAGSVALPHCLTEGRINKSVVKNN